MWIGGLAGQAILGNVNVKERMTVLPVGMILFIHFMSVPCFPFFIHRIGILYGLLR